MANTTVFTKKYLTSDEISYVVNEMVQRKNAVEREIVKVGMVAQLVIKDLGEYENCNDIYDYIMEKGVDLTKIVNYNDIDKFVNEELGVNKIIADFVEDFTKNISKSLEGLDLNGAIAQLKEIADNNTLNQVVSKEG